jgi:putative SOS response-associated peptidase YedK
LRTINAKAGTVQTSALHGEPYQRQHCFIPTDGFCERKKLDAKTKQSFRFVHENEVRWLAQDLSTDECTVMLAASAGVRRAYRMDTTKLEP